MTVLQCRRELRLFMKRQRGGDGIYRNSFSRIHLVQIEAVKLESEQKQRRAEFRTGN